MIKFNSALFASDILQRRVVEKKTSIQVVSSETGILENDIDNYEKQQSEPIISHAYILTDWLNSCIERYFVKLDDREPVEYVIKRVVCNYFNVAYGVIYSKQKTNEICKARQVSQYLLRQKTKMSLVKIGEFTGGRDHASVVHSLKVVGGLIEVDKEYRAQIEEIENKLGIDNI